MSEKRWDDTFAINLKPAFYLISRLAPVMIEHGGGKILNVSSVNFAGEAGSSDYGAAKAASRVADAFARHRTRAHDQRELPRSRPDRDARGRSSTRNCGRAIARARC